MLNAGKNRSVGVAENKVMLPLSSATCVYTCTIIYLGQQNLISSFLLKILKALCGQAAIIHYSLQLKTIEIGWYLKGTNHSMQL